MSDAPGGFERRDPNHPLRRPRDYREDGNRRRRWSTPERKYRLTYRRHPLVTLACTIAAVMASSVLAWGTTVVGSIYTDVAFKGSGWASCATPISWTTDTSNLSPAQASLVRPEISAAFASWAKVSGYTFTDGGEVAVKYDDVTSSVRPVLDINRNIAVYFVSDAKSKLLNKTIVGYGTPSRVYADSREIVNGYIVLNTDYLPHTNSAQREVLFMHEIGHALGLADSDDPGNIMFRYLDMNASMGSIASGDITGIKSIQKICRK